MKKRKGNKKRDTSVPYLQRKARQDSEDFYQGCLAGMKMMKVLNLIALWNVYDSIKRKLTTPQASELAQALYEELFRLHEEIKVNSDFAELLMGKAEDVAEKLGVKLWEEV